VLSKYDVIELLELA
jgi:integral membrane sensor domain MASE1